MTLLALVISERLDFRTAAKSALLHAQRTLEVRFAADARIGQSKLQEDKYTAVVVDDDTARGFFDESLHRSADGLIIRARSGGRTTIRMRQSPFSYLEVIVPDTRDQDSLQKALTQAMAEHGTTLKSEGLRPSATKVAGVAAFGQPAEATPGREPLRHPQPTQGSATGTTLANRTNPEIILPDILVIGSSTGGPEALERFFKAMEAWFVVPVVVVQHMPAGFTRGLAERIQRVSGFTMHEAAHEQVLVSGEVFIAPGDFHLRLRKAGDKVICSLDKGPLINSVRPAVDPMFGTAAHIYGAKVMSIVFTGMGEDGALGAQSIKNVGGCVAIQDEASCVVWGMPGAVSRLGLHDLQGNPEQIAAVVTRQMMRKGAPPKKLAKSA